MCATVSLACLISRENLWYSFLHTLAETSQSLLIERIFNNHEAMLRKNGCRFVCIFLCRPYLQLVDNTDSSVLHLQV